MLPPFLLLLNFGSVISVSQKRLSFLCDVFRCSTLSRPQHRSKCGDPKHKVGPPALRMETLNKRFTEEKKKHKSLSPVFLLLCDRRLAEPFTRGTVHTRFQERIPCSAILSDAEAAKRFRHIGLCYGARHWVARRQDGGVCCTPDFQR